MKKHLLETVEDQAGCRSSQQETELSRAGDHLSQELDDDPGADEHQHWSDQRRRQVGGH